MAFFSMGMGGGGGGVLGSPFYETLDETLVHIFDTAPTADDRFFFFFNKACLAGVL